MDETRKPMFLRKRDVVDALGMPKSTITDWINDFNVYIPSFKDGMQTYYYPETLDVLRAIRDMREKGLTKPQIMATLGEMGFAIKAEEAVDDIKNAIEQSRSSDVLQTVMTAVGQAVAKIHDHEKAITDIRELTEDHEEQLIRLQGEMKQVVGRVTDALELLQHQHSRLDEVRSEVSDQVGRVADEVASGLDTQYSAVQEIGSKVEVQTGRVQQVEGKMADQDDRIAEMEQKLAELAKQLEEAQKPWWKKLFSK